MVGMGKGWLPAVACEIFQGLGGIWFDSWSISAGHSHWPTLRECFERVEYIIIFVTLFKIKSFSDSCCRLDYASQQHLLTT